MKCVICGKSIDPSSLYCKNTHCRQAYDRKVSIVHNSAEYREYIYLYYMAEQEAIFRGDVAISE